MLKKELYRVILLTLFFTTIGFTQTNIESVVNDFIQKSKSNDKIIDNIIYSIKKVESFSSLFPNVYIVNLNPSGFIVISTDENLPEILAYSFDQNWTFDSEHPLVKILSSDLEKIYYSNAYKNITDQSNMLGSILGTDDFQQWPPENSTKTGGWIESTWHQNSPFNDFCPMDDFLKNRSLAGCIPVAFAQLVNYHHYIGDLKVSQQDSYKTRTRGLLIDQYSDSLDYPDFEMLNSYLSTIQTNYNNFNYLTDSEIAALMFACGLIIQTDYTYASSGAVLADIVPVLIERMGYKNADIIYASDDNFYEQLKQNAINALPVLLSMETHVAIVDGYNTNGYFHLNFGWGDNSPNAIQQCWYLLPSDLPYQYRDIYRGIFNISPSHKNMHGLNPSCYELQLSASKIQNYSDSQSFYIYNNYDIDVVVDSIITSPNFYTSLTNDSYVQKLTDITIKAGDSLKIFVNCMPDTLGLVKGSIKVVAMNDDLKRFITLELFGYGVENTGSVVYGGETSGIWTKENSPYYIIDDISIKPNSNLLIEPGVTVLFKGPYTFNVDKSCELLAKGTESDSIKFISLNDTENWAGFKIYYSGDDDSLLFCNFTDFKNEEAAGGVFFISNSSPIFKSCKFINNSANLGGAVYFTSSTPEFIQTHFINNNAPYGGAVYAHNSTSIFFQSLFTRNVSLKRGAAIYAKSSYLTLSNVTISNNVASYKSGNSGVLHLIGPGNTSILNSIFTSNYNIHGSGPFHITLEQSNSHEKSTVALNFNCFDSIDEDAIDPDVNLGQPGNDIIWGLGNITADPLFVTQTGQDFHLQIESPCIDAGDPDSDFLDEPFPHGFCINMGAYGGTKSATEQHHPRLTSLPNAIYFTQLSNTFRDKKKINIVNGTDKLLKITDFVLSDSTHFQIKNINEQYIKNSEYILPPGVQDDFNLIIDLNHTDLMELHETLTISIEDGDDCIIPIDINSISGTNIDSQLVSGVWTKDKSPYVINNNIKIPANETLIIEPGVSVVFNGNLKFDISENAQLIANGTVNDSIRFIAQNADLGWRGIYFYKSSNDDTLKFCHISGIKIQNSSYSNNYGVLVINQSSPLIENCLFTNNDKVSNINLINIIHSDAQIKFIKVTYNNNFTSLFNFDQSSNVILEHITVSNNTCNTIFNSQKSNFQLNNSVIYGNSLCGKLSDNTDTYRHFNSIHIKNSIIYNNVDLYVFDTGYLDTLSVSYSALDLREIELGHQGNKSGQIRNLVVWGKGNINSNPLFVGPEKGNFTLNPASPCIDAGDPDDFFDKEPMPNGYRINMGIYGGTESAKYSSKTKLTVSPGKISFGKINLNFDKSEKIYLKNGSPNNININSIKLTDSTLFKLKEFNGGLFNNNSRLLLPGQIDSFLVVFKSVNIEGDFDNQLFIKYNNDKSDYVNITASTYLGTKITALDSSDIWTLSNSPYNIYNDIYIYNGTSLQINPGVTVRFMGNSTIFVRDAGKLVANGTKDEMIKFVTLNNDSAFRNFEFINSGNDDSLFFYDFSNLNLKETLFKLNQTSPFFYSSIFNNNAIPEETVLFYCVDANPVFQKCQFQNNIASGKGLYDFFNSNSTFKNCLISDNITDQSGGLIFSLHSKFNFKNCTIYNNFSERLGGIIYCGGINNSIKFMNSILWQNFSSNKDIVYSSGTAEVTFQYCCIDTTNPFYVTSLAGIQGKVNWGKGNFYSDPLLISPENGDFTLSDLSPCIDAGNPEVSYNDIEDPVNPGRANLPAKGTVRNDMGYYGGNPYFNITTAIEDEDESTIPDKFALMQNYPNPFNGNTLIEFHLPVSGNVEINVYNIQGQKVKTITESRYSNGVHTLLWDGTSDSGTLVSSGIYLYRILLDNNQSITKRLVFIK